jgi:hypothetical protein
MNHWQQLCTFRQVEYRSLGRLGQLEHSLLQAQQELSLQLHWDQQGPQLLAAVCAMFALGMETALG